MDNEFILDKIIDNKVNKEGCSYRAHPCVGVFRSEESFIDFLISYYVPKYGTCTYNGIEGVSPLMHPLIISAIDKREDVFNRLENYKIKENDYYENSILDGLLREMRYSAMCQRESCEFPKDDPDDEIIKRWASKDEYSSDNIKILVAKLLVLKGKV